MKMENLGLEMHASDVETDFRGTLGNVQLHISLWEIKNWRAELGPKGQATSQPAFSLQHCSLQLCCIRGRTADVGSHSWIVARSVTDISFEKQLSFLERT